MSLTGSGQALLLRKKYRVSVGDALFVIVYPSRQVLHLEVSLPLLVKDKGGTTKSVLWEGSREVDAEAGKGEVVRLDQLRKAGEDPRF